jgi:hypothetical protein
MLLSAQTFLHVHLILILLKQDTRRRKLMRIQYVFAGLLLAFAASAAMATNSWSIQEDRGNTVLIRCADGSNSTVAKANGGWTVLSAGAKGKVGGQYDIVGQAALAGCGE